MFPPAKTLKYYEQVFPSPDETLAPENFYQDSPVNSVMFGEQFVQRALEGRLYIDADDDNKHQNVDVIALSLYQSFVRAYNLISIYKEMTLSAHMYFLDSKGNLSQMYPFSSYTGVIDTHTFHRGMELIIRDACHYFINSDAPMGIEADLDQSQASRTLKRFATHAHRFLTKFPYEPMFTPYLMSEESISTFRQHSINNAYLHNRPDELTETLYGAFEWTFTQILPKPEDSEEETEIFISITLSPSTSLISAGFDTDDSIFHF